MIVAVQQRNIPLDGPAEAFVMMAAHRNIAAKEDREVYRGILGDPPQERRLILDGMADEIGEPIGAFHRKRHILLGIKFLPLC